MVCGQRQKALRRATAPGVEAEIRVEEVADEILLDLKIAFVGVHHPRQDVHVGDEFTFLVVNDFAVFVAVGKTVHL